MSRLRPPGSVAPRVARLLLAACVAMWSADATAQTYTDPLTPKLQTDPRNPPRFRQFSQPSLVQLGPPTNFLTPASGAGVTGFDSTNSRKKVRTRTKANSSSNAQAISPGLAEPLMVSPFQKPPADTAGGAYAAAPGTPPVELGPIRQGLKKHKAHTEPEDPYAPLGVHAAAFTLLPAVELIGGYNTNPGATSVGRGAALYTVAPELQAQSNWSRHELKVDLRGSYTGYSPDQTPTLSRPNLNGKINGRVDVTKNTRIDLSGRVLVGTDDPGSPNLAAGLAKLPVFTTVGGSAGLGQKFNRLDLSIKGDVERTVWQDSSLVDGSTFSNKDRQYNQYTGKARAGYELMPGVMPFVEASTDARVHDLETDSAGFERDSKGLTGIVGSTVELTQLLKGEIGIGYTRRTYEDPRLEAIKSPVGDVSLIWTANALTTVKLTGKSSVGETTIPGVSGVLYRDIGLQIDHSLRRWLIATFKAGAGIDDYVGLDREDKRYSLGVGLTYKLNRSVQIKGEAQQNWLHSNVAGSDYMSSVFLLGVRLQR